MKNLDIGWWPLDEWGLSLRLAFLGRVTGVPVRQLPTVAWETFRADPAGHYRNHYEKEIASTLRAGRPVVAEAGHDVGVVFGMDRNAPPLLMQLACSPEKKLARAKQYPHLAFVFDAPGSAIDRRQADIEALEFAVRFGRDEVDLSHLPGKSSGRRSWELWVNQLADEELCGPHFYHANVVRVLRIHRRAAAGYLRTMSRRHSGPARQSLQQAAETYDSVLKLLDQANTSKDRLAVADGREQLISLIRQIMPLEAQAQDQMAESIKHMK